MNYPLSYNQRPIWFLHELAPDSPINTVAMTVRIVSSVDVAALQRAFRALTVRHPILRATFTMQAGQPVQVVGDVQGVSFTTVDASAWDEARLNEQVQAACACTFDLRTGPLLQVMLFNRTPQDHVLVVAMHHIIVDGWSAWLMLEEVGQLYTAARQPEGVSSPALPSLTRQYSDFVAWQAALLAGVEGQRLRAYWRRRLAGDLPVLALPHQRPLRPIYAGAAHPFTLSETASQGLKRLARTEGVTPFTLLLAAFQALLYGYTGQEDIIVGAPVAGRNRAFGRVVGNFMNMVALRADLGHNPTFRAFLQQARQTVSEALAHQQYPFSLLAEQLAWQRRPDPSPLFQVAFVLQKPPRRLAPVAALLAADEAGRRLTVGDLTLATVGLSQQPGQLDLLLEMAEAQERLTGVFRYPTGLFTPLVIEQLCHDFAALLSAVVADPGRRLGNLGPLHKPAGVAIASPAEAVEAATPAFVAPRTPVEANVAEIWADVLGLERTGVHTNFFAAGGHSLLAMQVITRIGRTLAVELPLRALFETPTIAGLAERVEAAQAGERSLPSPIQPAPRTEPLPLSFSQERMWFLQQWQPDSAAYNIPFATRLKGRLDVAALAQSLNELVRRHEILRTVIVVTEGEPVQQIMSNEIALPLTDLARHPGVEAECRRRVNESARQPFDLARWPLLRPELFRLAKQDHVLLLTLHHAIADAWSVGVLAREWVALYEAISAGKPAQLPALSVQYADFAQAQRRWLEGEAVAAQLAYWRQQLAHLPALALPTDRPRPGLQTYTGAQQSFTPVANLLAPLRALSQAENASLFMTLLAAFKVLLYRYSGQEDIAVGAPAANRHWPGSEWLVGTFVNPLVLRSHVTADLTFRQLLQQVRETCLQAYAHQDLPFEKLVAELQPSRDASHTPLFQVMFDYTNVPTPALELPGLQWELLEVDRGAAQFDLTLSVLDTRQLQRIGVEYNSDLFEAATMARLLGHFQVLLEAIAANPEATIGQLPLLTGDEQQQLLVDWVGVATERPQAQCLHQLFEAQAARTPEAVAVVGEGEQLTYSQLNERANQVARHLHGQGVGPETLVAIALDPSPALVVGLLGILKAGGAYLPLDPALPPARLAFMLADAGVSLMLTQQRLAPRFATAEVRHICLDSDWPVIRRQRRENLPLAVDRQSLAYVIYTSGSTGQPKGVQIQHGSLINLLLAMQQEPGLAATDVFLAVTTVSFDIAALEIFLPLITGARLALVGRETVVDSRRLEKAMAASGATVMQATPATWRGLIEAGWRGDRQLRVWCGGEALSRDLAGQLLSRAAAVWNLYGPTETTIWSAVAPVVPGHGPVPIGRPIANTQFYVLDSCLQPAPIGVPGELHIGGLGLARGYLNQPALTSEKFINLALTPHATLLVPHASRLTPHASSLLYKTGDLVRWRPDGNLEFLGRLDHQVKIRGFRVELGEIEARLRQHPALREAVVVRQDDAVAEPSLVAYLVADGERPPQTADLRAYLQQQLPDYMLPSIFVWLEALPLTPSGKVDRRTLPPPEPAHRRAQAPVAPRNQLEAQLVSLWQSLLPARPIGVRDDFFELGGHSLLAVRLLAHVEVAFGVNLPLTALFQDATIQQLAHLIGRQAGLSVWPSLAAIQPGGSRPPFFCVHGLTGDVAWYTALARHLGPDQPFYGLQSRGLDGLQAPLQTVAAMADHYIEAMRSVQPEGPYFLGGYSYGGIVALEMAQQLQAQGQQVSLLAIIDAPAGSDYFRVALTPAFLMGFLQALPFWLQDIRLMGWTQVWNRLRWRAWRAWSQFRSGFKRSSGGRDDEITAEMLVDHASQLPRHRRRLIESNYRAMRAYAPQPYPGRVTLLRPRHDRLLCSHDPLMGWGRLAGAGVDVRIIPGSHLQLFSEPFVQRLAQQLHAAIQASGIDKKKPR